MPASRGLRKRRTQEQWSEIFRRFAASGLGKREFCRREGVPLSSLQRWRARVGAAPASLGFVEVAAAPAAPSVQEGWTVELTLPGGVSLRVRG